MLTCEGQPHALWPGQARHSVTVTVWRCWEDGRPPTPPTRSCWRCCGLGRSHTLRTCEIGHLRNAATLGLAVLIVFDDFFSGGSHGNADWEGRKADSTGIGPVHREWTIVDGGEKMRVPAKPRRLLRGHRDAPRSGAVPAYRLFGVSSVGVSGALAVCRSRQRARLAAIFLSLRARIAAANSAALTAPARPMASVPTGTPAGI